MQVSINYIFRINDGRHIAMKMNGFTVYHYKRN